MSDDRVLERIAGWEAAGLIDAATAARLRAAETASAGAPMRSAAASAFGPGLAITEIFGYLGAAFLLGAWHSLVASMIASEICEAACRHNVVRDISQWLVAAALLLVAGLAVSTRGERGRRAAGVAYLVATVHVIAGVQLLFAFNTGFDVTETLFAGAAGTAVAFVFRRIQPALLTELALLAGAVVLAYGAMEVLEKALLGPASPSSYERRPFLAIAWWLAVAVAFGVLARWEADRAAAGQGGGDRDAAARRAGMTRLAAGLTAVVGTAFGVLGGFGDRPFAAWMDDLVLGALSALLLALAIRSGAAGFLYPAALGLFITFSDLNAQYVAAETGTGVALLVEGAILLAVGFGADRLRRQLESRGSSSAPYGPEAAPADATSA